ncbi:MAG: LamG domain-containing protein, partial [Verrucomicrobiae bacterium]|nr:LamG domain-containing protein [Verrucomicrobiae bacterium]
MGSKTRRPTPTGAGRRWASVRWWTLLLGLAGIATALGQPATTNHVLVLNGRGAHAVLPAEPFRDLTNATVECWVRWEDLGPTRRIFNYGRPRRDVSLMSRDGRDLGFVIGDARAYLHWLIVPGVVERGVWLHLAAVGGEEGMRLHLNGVPLLPVQPYTGGFMTAADDGVAYLGKSVTPSDAENDFNGALDEFRVWNRALSPEEIRAGLFRQATPGEEGLVFLASFEPGEVSVRLADGARLEAAELPASAAQLSAPLTVSGRREASEIPPPPATIPSRAAGGAGISFVAGLLAAFCLMHSLFFAFQRQTRTHLYFALISGLGAAYSWPLFALRDASRHWLPILAVLVWRLFQLLFAPNAKPPPRALVFAAVLVAATLPLHEIAGLQQGV